MSQLDAHLSLEGDIIERQKYSLADTLQCSCSDTMPGQLLTRFTPREQAAGHPSVQDLYEQFTVTLHV